MNKVFLMGRLTADPEYKSGEAAVAHYTLAVNRRTGEQADFIRCVVFRAGADFANKYFKKGMRIVIAGRIQTGSYTNKDGVKVYTTDVIVDEQDFADSKR